MTSTFRLGRIAASRSAPTGVAAGRRADHLVARRRGVPGDQSPAQRHTYSRWRSSPRCCSSPRCSLHELGHAVQARREGIEIEGITLWVFGGVAGSRAHLPRPARSCACRRGPGRLAGHRRRLPGRRDRVPLPPRSTAWCSGSADQPVPARLQHAARAPARRRPRVARDPVGRRRTSGRRPGPPAGWASFFGQLLIAGGLLLLIFVGRHSVAVARVHGLVPARRRGGGARDGRGA